MSFHTRPQITRLTFLLVVFFHFACAENCYLKCQIPLTVEPKCGSNGITYQNTQELLCAKTQCFPDLYLASDGHCRHNTATAAILKTPRTGIYVTAATITPVSSKNHTGIFSKIAMKQGRRRRPYSTSSAVMNSQSPNALSSCDLQACICDFILYPVCGSNGVTYGNQCVLECAQGCHQGLTMHHRGFCGKIFFPNPLDKFRFFHSLEPAEDAGIHSIRSETNGHTNLLSVQLL